MRLLLIGAGGQLASDLVKALVGHDVVALSHRDVEVCDADQVRAAVGGCQPDVVINTAAFHRVDDCEVEVERAFAVNAAGPLHLARACQEAGAALLHLSTDYVFGGQQRCAPYLEEDAPLPINVYGVAKLAGEALIRYNLDRHYIVRTSGLYGAAGASGKGGNFVNTMLRLAREGNDVRVVADQRLTPTYTADLAHKIAWLITTEAYGVWHITSGGDCTWYEFAAEIFRQAGLRPNLSPTTTAEYGARARRPAYSVLGHGRLRQAGADDLPPWPQALSAYLREVGAIGQ